MILGDFDTKYEALQTMSKKYHSVGAAGWLSAECLTLCLGSGCDVMGHEIKPPPLGLHT